MTNLQAPEGGEVGPAGPGFWDMGDALEPAREAFYMKDQMVSWLEGNEKRHKHFEHGNLRCPVNESPLLQPQDSPERSYH